MKKAFIILLSFILLVSYDLYSQNNPKVGLEQITPELLKRHIDFLASDELKGRNTPSPGLDSAAVYIANEFINLGIEKVNSSYFQNIPMCSKDLDIANTYLKFSENMKEANFKLKKDFNPFDITGNQSVSAPVVFVGYGITAPEFGYDDYEDLDVDGKIVLVMKHEPREKDTSSIFYGDKDTYHSTLENKIANAKKHGAVGMLLVTDPLNHLLINPQGYPWPSLFFKSMSGSKLPIKVCATEYEMSIPVVQVGEEVINYLFGSIDKLRNIQKEIDSTMVPNSFQINKICDLQTKIITKRYTAKNVVGIIKGKDTKLKNEIIVIGGHYDHVGYKEKSKQGEDSIFNGADDNASGTAGVMAIAKAFKKMKQPDRSVLFILFAGEEKGLYGSKYYVENPLYPIEKTIAMLNLDMISRNSDSLQLIGEKENPDLAEIARQEAANYPLKIVNSDDHYLGGSDHYNFYKNGVSSLFFFTGIHNDYHRVSDNPDSVDHLKASNVSKLAFHLAWIIANSNKYYKINKN
ncbi:MAG: M20/M25/M40 family metallo-hydrolase [Bacteroidales bacterium]